MRSSPSSLLDLSTHYFISNLRLYDSECLKTLPSHLKHRILKAFLSSSYFWKSVNFKMVFSSLVDSHLVRIDLSDIDVEDEILSFLIPCTMLREVSINGSWSERNNLTKAGLMQFLENKRDLRLIRIPHCKVMDDEVLELLVKSCPKVCGLDISFSKEVTDQGIVALTGLEELTSLSISDTRVTNDGVQALIDGPPGKTLKELRINYCQNLSNFILYDVANRCPQLEVLIFHSCTGDDSKAEEPFSSLEGKALKHLKQITWTVTW